MKFGEILAGSFPVIGLAAICGVVTCNELKHAKTEMVQLSPERTVKVLNWNNGGGIEVYIGGFQSLCDTNKDGKVDYIYGGAMSRQGSIHYIKEPNQFCQELYTEAISKTSQKTLGER